MAMGFGLLRLAEAVPSGSVAARVAVMSIGTFSLSSSAIGSIGDRSSSCVILSMFFVGAGVDVTQFGG